MDVLDRAARVLLGWLDDDAVAHVVASPLAARLGEPAEVERRIASARASVTARAPRVRDAVVVQDATGDLGTHVVLEPGERIALVDLSMVRATQPYVFIDTDLQVDPDASRPTLATITLPSRSRAEVALHYDEDTSTYVATSRHQHLQIVGHVSGPFPDAPPGTELVGFLVGVPPSCLRVELVDGRALLVDGHHRAAALLAAGIRVVPAVLAVGDGSEVSFTPLLGSTACLGPRAPYVSDYLCDEVALGTTLPYVGRQVRVRAEESDLFPDEPR